MELADGTIIKGVTDDLGRTEQIKTADMQTIKVFWNTPHAADSDDDIGITEGC